MILWQRLCNIGSGSATLVEAPQHWYRLRNTGTGSATLVPAPQHWYRLHNTGTGSTTLVVIIKLNFYVNTYQTLSLPQTLTIQGNGVCKKYYTHIRILAFFRISIRLLKASNSDPDTVCLINILREKKQIGLGFSKGSDSDFFPPCQ